MKTSPVNLFLIFLTAISSVSCNPPAASDLFIDCLRETFPEPYPFSGIVFLRNDPAFRSVLEAYARNLRYSGPATMNPNFAIVAKNEGHVKGTVICAKKAELEIRIRSGGHDYEGLSYVSEVPYVVLDLHEIRSISIDLQDRTAWVDAGATTGELYYAIAKASKTLAFPAGVCTMLGTGGHFSGGAYGNLMRKYGLSVDNILDAKIVNAAGEVLDRKSMGEDLFWAIRGGGGASFGVILSWKINLVLVPEKVTVFSVTKTLEQGGTDLVLKWQQVADLIDDELFIRVQLSSANGTVKVNFIALFQGQTPQLISIMNAKFPELGLRAADCSEMRWVESTLFWFGLPNGTPLEFLLNRVPRSTVYFKRKSDYVKAPIPKEGLEAVWAKMIKVGNVSMQWNPYGGMMARVKESETPFPHTAGNKFLVQYATNWVDEKNTEANLDMTEEVYDSMAPYVSKFPREAFLNYRDLDIGVNSDGTAVFGFKYFKGNFERLVRVKKAVDPDNFFKNEQSIPTSKKY